jgi:hypothetical protein
MRAIVLALYWTVTFGWAQAWAGSPDLFVQDHGACYRIPAIAADASGGMLAIAEQRFGPASAAASAEIAANPDRRCQDSGSISLVYRLSANGGETWSPMRTLVAYQDFVKDGYRVALVGNPTILALRGAGHFLVMFVVTRTAGDDNSAACIEHYQTSSSCGGFPADHRLWQVETQDGGRSWRPARPVPLELGPPLVRPGPGNGTRLPGGRLIVPVYGAMLISDDDGRSWRRGAAIAPVLDPAVSFSESLVIGAGGKVWVFGRLVQRAYRVVTALVPEAVGPRLVARSDDQGESFAEVWLDWHLPAPPIQIGALVEDEHHALISFPYFDAPTNGAPSKRDRSRLTLGRLDLTGGASDLRVLDCGMVGYSSMARLPGGDIGILYEAVAEDGRKLRYRRFSPTALLAEEQGDRCTPSVPLRRSLGRVRLFPKPPAELLP